MNDKRVSVEGDKQFRALDVLAHPRSVPCDRGTPGEGYAHDMEAVEVIEGGPTVLYCRRGCGLVQRLEVPA